MTTGRAHSSHIPRGFRVQRLESDHQSKWSTAGRGMEWRGQPVLCYPQLWTVLWVTAPTEPAGRRKILV